MKPSTYFSLVAALLLALSSSIVAAQESHIINAQTRMFAPDILYIQPGDSVQWQNMTSHDTVSIEGLIPEGAQPWRGPISENFGVTLTVEGVYAYVCEPHIGFGMMGVKNWVS